MVFYREMPGARARVLRQLSANGWSRTRTLRRSVRSRRSRAGRAFLEVVRGEWLATRVPSERGVHYAGRETAVNGFRSPPPGKMARRPSGGYAPFPTPPCDECRLRMELLDDTGLGR